MDLLVECTSSINFVATFYVLTEIREEYRTGRLPWRDIDSYRSDPTNPRFIIEGAFRRLRSDWLLFNIGGYNLYLYFGRASKII